MTLYCEYCHKPFEKKSGKMPRFCCTAHRVDFHRGKVYTEDFKFIQELHGKAANAVGPAKLDALKSKAEAFYNKIIEGVTKL